MMSRIKKNTAKVMRNSKSRKNIQEILKTTEWRLKTKIEEMKRSKISKEGQPEAQPKREHTDNEQKM